MNTAAKNVTESNRMPQLAAKLTATYSYIDNIKLPTVGGCVDFKGRVGAELTNIRSLDQYDKTLIITNKLYCRQNKWVQ